MRNHQKFYLYYTGDTIEIRFVPIGPASVFTADVDTSNYTTVLAFAKLHEPLAKETAASLNTAYNKGWERGREAVVEAFKEAVGMGE
jgi:hypothetical protein